MKRTVLAFAAIAPASAVTRAMPAEAAKPEGTLTAAVATFGNERWLPQLYVGAEDIVLKPPWEWPGINGHTGLDNWEYVTRAG